MVAFPLASIAPCTIGDEAAGGGGAIIFGIGLSGSDSEDKESNLLWVSREAVVSNKHVEKFGILHFMHYYTMFLPDDLFRILYIVEDMP